MKLNTYRHFYLYSKWHYKKTNVLEDLKCIMEDCFGISKCKIRDEDIAEVMLVLVYKHMHCRNDVSEFVQFIFRLSPNSTPIPLKEDKDPDFLYILIRNCIAMLSSITIDEIEGGLGDPDPNILALASD